MSEATTNGIEAKIARLETSMSSLASTVATLSASQHESNRILEAKIDSLSSNQKTNWPLLGLLFSGIVAASGLVHYVLSERVAQSDLRVNAVESSMTARLDMLTQMARGDNENQTDHIRTINDRLSLLRGEHDRLASDTVSKMQRVETQLAGLSNLTNTNLENLRGWASEHHWHLHGRPLPDKTFWPTVGRDVGAHE